MNILSWNVNGIRACTRKADMPSAGIYCFQEIKANEQQAAASVVLPGYQHFIFPAQKKGYAGVSVHTRMKPPHVQYGIGEKEIDDEGRVVTLEFEDFCLINAYFPHAHRELLRLGYKNKFNQSFQRFCLGLGKPVVVASDFNVAHKEKDLANPRQNDGNAGFTREEREWFDGFLKAGFIDTFRMFCADEGHYTWWPYALHANEILDGGLIML